MKKPGFSLYTKQIYYIDAKGKDIGFDRWRVCLYYAGNFAATYFLETEQEYFDFLIRHIPQCYSDYEEFRKDWDNEHKPIPQTGGINYATA